MEMARLLQSRWRRLKQRIPELRPLPARSIAMEQVGAVSSVQSLTRMRVTGDVMVAMQRAAIDGRGVMQRMTSDISTWDTLSEQDAQNGEYGVPVDEFQACSPSQRWLL